MRGNAGKGVVRSGLPRSDDKTVVVGSLRAQPHDW
jgi:hypothetical protein